MTIRRLMSQAVSTATAMADPPDSRSMAASCDGAGEDDDREPHGTAQAVAGFDGGGPRHEAEGDDADGDGERVPRPLDLRSDGLRHERVKTSDAASGPPPAAATATSGSPPT